MNKVITLFIITVLSINAHAQLIKVSEQGLILKSDDVTHRCVIDDESELVWEVKLLDKGLQNTQNTYTWFDGKSGVENGDYSHNCHWGESCNTQSYINGLNAEKLCQQATWRLPSEQELKTLLIYGDDELLINKHFFPNTQLKSYWSSSEQDDNIAIDVPFFYGGSKSSDKSFDAHIRAVSDAN